MKTQILIIQAALVVGMAVFGLGCSSGSSGFQASQNNANGGGATGGTTGDNTGGTTGSSTPNCAATDAGRGAEWQAGSIATLTPDWNGWVYYAATHPLNNPCDLKVSVKLSNTDGKYHGKVMVSYMDNNQYYTGRFITQNKKNASGTTHGHDGKHHAEYNRWFSWSGPRGNPRVAGGATNVFHGFYEDQYGAILLIVDGMDNQGDGQSSALKGEVWVRNYITAQAPRNPNGVPCWFLELGPYDCRTFLTSSENLSTASALYPDQSLHAGGGWYPSYNQTSTARGWKLLGRFSGLDRAKAGL